MSEFVDYAETWSLMRGEDIIDKIYPMVAGLGHIAGSFATWCARWNEDQFKYNDVDIFAKSKADYETLMSRICNAGWYPALGGLNVQRFIKPGSKLPEIQVINPPVEWKTFPYDVLNSFDLSHSRALLVSSTEVLADCDIQHNELRVLRINDPVRTLQRITKYAGKGIGCPELEYLKVLEAYHKIDDEKKSEIWLRYQEEEIPGDYWDEQEVWFEE